MPDDRTTRATPAQMLDALERDAERIAELEAERERMRAERDHWAAVAEECMSFLGRLEAGFCVVPSSACSPWEIALARATGRMLVTPDALGYIRTALTPAAERDGSGE